MTETTHYTPGKGPSIQLAQAPAAPKTETGDKGKAANQAPAKQPETAKAAETVTPPAKPRTRRRPPELTLPPAPKPDQDMEESIFDFHDPSDNLADMETESASPEKASDHESPADDENARAESGKKGEEDAKDADGGGLDEELLARAEEAGITREMARQFPNAAVLDAMLTGIERAQAKRPSPEEKAKETKPEAGQPAEKAGPLEFKPFELDVDEEMVDPDTYASLKKMTEHFNGAVQSLVERFQEQMKTVQEFHDYKENQQRSAFQKEIDGLFADLKRDDLFGKGSYADLAKTSKEFKAREQLLEAMSEIQLGRDALGKPRLPYKTLMERAFQLEFGAHTKTNGNAKKKDAEAPRDGNGRFTERPSQRQSDAGKISPRQAALLNLRRNIQTMTRGNDERELINESFLD